MVTALDRENSSLPTQQSTNPRILLAKIGLDGHDRGVKVLARSFRDAAFEVIYTGLWQTCESTMYAAMQEDVDVVGVSLLSAAHMTVMPEMLRIRKVLGVEAIPVVLGGIVPESDYAPLREMGVAAVFNPGSPMDAIVEKMRELAAARRRLSLEQARAGYGRHDARALATLISAIISGAALDGLDGRQAGTKIIGVTGSPGVGKSSFIARLGRQLRDRGKTVAVVAVDPSSPVTGGALLGDRLRMMSAKPDEGFFVRSLASGPVQGGLGPYCREIVELLRGFGFDFVLVETVGAGQADVAIRDLADEVILVLMPESGDSIQFSKAGIMEIVGCFVLNKCDLPGADATQGQLLSVVADDRPIWKVSTIRDEGFDAVTDWAMGLA
ncbi:MAG: cobalamin-dependent protein [Phycisphaerae bacterium]